MQLRFANKIIFIYISQVNIGKNTRITSRQFAVITWQEPWCATKDLAMAVFGRNVLATHSLTGHRSNSHKGGETKPALDPIAVHEMLGKNYEALKFM
jgi:predicted  nucleic acid-binding Zn ribbon protein